MEFFNLTPYRIDIITDDGTVSIAPYGFVARISMVTVTVETLESGIAIVDSRLGEPVGIPEQKDGVGYIVSDLVRTALWDREDLFSPGDMVRDLEGKATGSCQSLVCNPLYRMRTHRCHRWAQ